MHNQKPGWWERKQHPPVPHSLPSSLKAWAVSWGRVGVGHRQPPLRSRKAPRKACQGPAQPLLRPSEQDSPALGQAGRRWAGQGKAGWARHPTWELVPTFSSVPCAAPAPARPPQKPCSPLPPCPTRRDLQPATSHGTAGVSCCQAQGADELHVSGTKPGCVKGAGRKGPPANLLMPSCKVLPASRHTKKRFPVNLILGRCCSDALRRGGLCLCVTPKTK